MRSIPIIALAAAVLLLSPCAASAQAWPSRPVTMMVPFPAGGTADLLARGIAQALSDALGQPFVVENRAGASGNLAAGAVAKGRLMAPACCSPRKRKRLSTNSCSRACPMILHAT
jgi:tripartite-type tricarboxylate transporter receptor subunit TctC